MSLGAGHSSALLGLFLDAAPPRWDLYQANSTILSPPDLDGPPRMLVAFSGAVAMLVLKGALALAGRVAGRGGNSVSSAGQPVVPPDWPLRHGYRAARISADPLVYGKEEERHGVCWQRSWARVSIHSHLILGCLTVDQKVTFQQKVATLCATAIAAGGLVAMLSVRAQFPAGWSAAVSGSIAWPLGLLMHMLYEHRPWFPPEADSSAAALESWQEAGSVVQVCEGEMQRRLDRDTDFIHVMPLQPHPLAAVQEAGNSVSPASELAGKIGSLSTELPLEAASVAGVTSTPAVARATSSSTNVQSFRAARLPLPAGEERAAGRPGTLSGCKGPASPVHWRARGASALGPPPAAPGHAAPMPEMAALRPALWQHDVSIGTFKLQHGPLDRRLVAAPLPLLPTSLADQLPAGAGRGGGFQPSSDDRVPSLAWCPGEGGTGAAPFLASVGLVATASLAKYCPAWASLPSSWETGAPGTPAGVARPGIPPHTFPCFSSKAHGSHHSWQPKTPIPEAVAEATTPVGLCSGLTLGSAAQRDTVAAAQVVEGMGVDARLEARLPVPPWHVLPSMLSNGSMEIAKASVSEHVARVEQGTTYSAGRFLGDLNYEQQAMDCICKQLQHIQATHTRTLSQPHVQEARIDLPDQVVNATLWLANAAVLCITWTGCAVTALYWTWLFGSAASALSFLGTLLGSWVMMWLLESIRMCLITLHELAGLEHRRCKTQATWIQENPELWQLGCSPRRRGASWTHNHGSHGNGSAGAGAGGIAADATSTAAVATAASGRPSGLHANDARGGWWQRRRRVAPAPMSLRGAGTGGNG